jgi:hypothetical protein
MITSCRVTAASQLGRYQLPRKPLLITFDSNSGSSTGPGRQFPLQGRKTEAGLGSAHEWVVGCSADSFLRARNRGVFGRLRARGLGGIQAETWHKG